MKKENDLMLGWHFIPENKKLRYNDNRIVRAGRVYKISKSKPLNLCEYGLHASKNIMDALYYAPGTIICRVELRGEILRGDDKACAYERKVLWMLDATNILHEFACLCAEDALALVEKPDERSINAIKVKRLWLDGKASDDDLAAAWAAASDAAWAAASDAAWAAASDAARASAWAAARAAAWAAGDAGKKKQYRRLVAMVSAERGKCK